MEPKSAGRARKKVELSSVRLMIADEGNKLDGVWKEKKARKPLLEMGAEASVIAWSCGCEYSSEKNVKRVGKRSRHINNRTKRDVGILKQ